MLYSAAVFNLIELSNSVVLFVSNEQRIVPIWNFLDMFNHIFTFLTKLLQVYTLTTQLRTYRFTGDPVVTLTDKGELFTIISTQVVFTPGNTVNNALFTGLN